MNRRSFLKRFATATAAALATNVFDDPERLLWVPGQKTIVDLGATKQVLPATDAEVIDQATSIFTERGWVKRNHTDFNKLGADALMPWQKVERNIRLDIAGSDGELRSFHYKGDKLVSTHTPEDLRLLDRPLRTRP
jgi:hypothetical protein